LDTPSLPGAWRISVPESVTARRTFLVRVRVVQHVDGALLRATRRRHLPVRVLEVHDARAHVGDAVLGHHERVAEARVEAPGDVPHELDVLPLVLPDRHFVGAVGEHVGGLEHRIEQQPRRDELALRRGLVAELVHAVELAERGH
jgi:hypothetical protein